MDKDSSTVVYVLCDCCFHEAWAGPAPQMDVVLDEIGSACCWLPCCLGEIPE